MPKKTEDQLNQWRYPPSDSEETKLNNAERMIRSALQDDEILNKMDITVFGQGSYANDTNIRLDSDIDINARYNSAFYYEIPDGSTKEDFGIVDAKPYLFKDYKIAVYNALVSEFGSDGVEWDKSCISVLGNTNRIEADVVPTWEFRRYSADGSYCSGTKFQNDEGNWITNYPLRHIENGKIKNSNSKKRFKRLTRIFKRLRNAMIDDGVNVDDSITSFLLESLIWNTPNSILSSDDGWNEITKFTLIHLYEHLDNAEKSKEWGEVSELLYLFHSERKWNRDRAKEFTAQAWEYLEYE